MTTKGDNMNIVFYVQTNPSNKLEKELTNGVNANGVLRNQTSILTPSINIVSKAIPPYNYCYIPSFKRYYYITNIESVRDGLVKIDCKVDVLKSYVSEIKRAKAKAKTAENINPYYDGLNIENEVRYETEQINFPKIPFDETGEIILVGINGTGVE